eukprot:CAMPEP_0167830606 /NCGR_PEP_ID=MMETSP0112_2-20121227/13061_1 /TAXON_ID=91324 /ORGANISM="Lotharella globosa, Strain CCCM811" /LENGTH=64 /DNA_ID=CAMNT_0007734935 /DNA_START=647 /DNA_END=837 /DNA_ORIENTATION=+
MTWADLLGPFIAEELLLLGLVLNPIEKDGLLFRGLADRTLIRTNGHGAGADSFSGDFFLGDVEL